MIDKKKGEVEKMGEFVGGGVKQGWSVIKSFGKGVSKKAFQKKRNKNNCL